MATIILPGPTPGIVSTAGTRLDLIEREVAMRSGPFFYEKALSHAGTRDTVIVENLKSVINSIELENMYLLRRGFDFETGEVIPHFPDDRIRVVVRQNSETGTLLVDRDWTLAPTPGEALEFHHLHPEMELRRAVLNGLRRCYFVDRSSFPLSALAYERNITLLAPWITRVEHLYDVQYMPISGYQIPRSIRWWEAFHQDGDVWLKATDPFPNQLVLVSRKTHFEWVNGLFTPDGPIQVPDMPLADLNLLDLSLNYAAAAGHIEAWRIARARMMAAAREGNAVTQQEAATEFSRQAQDEFSPPHRIPIQFSTPRSYHADEESQVVVT